MTPRGGRRLLLFAFALSLLIHLIFAVAWHRPNHSREGQTEVVTLDRRRVAITKLPTPPPRRHVTVVPHPAPRTRPAPHSAKGTRAAGNGGGYGRATAAPTLAPLPATTPGNACADPNAGAAVAATPEPPDIPLAARADATSGIALVTVQLDAGGAVTAAAVSQSTGNAGLDDVAVAMARQARYAPALHDCKPVSATYTYSVKFAAW